MKHKNIPGVSLPRGYLIATSTDKCFWHFETACLHSTPLGKMSTHLKFETNYGLMLLTTYKMSKKASYRQGLKYKPYTEILLPIKSPEEGSSRRKHILYCVTLLDSVMLHFSLLGTI